MKCCKQAILQNWKGGGGGGLRTGQFILHTYVCTLQEVEADKRRFDVKAGSKLPAQKETLIVPRTVSIWG